MNQIKVSEAKIENTSKIGRIAFQTAMFHYQSIKNEFKKPTFTGQVDYIKKSILNKDILVLKAELKNEIVGYVVVYFNTYPERYFKFHKRGFIGSIGVDETYRGQGVGKALLQGVEDKLKKQGISVVEIDVYAFNEAAKKLYDNFGYEEIKHYKRKFIK